MVELGDDDIGVVVEDKFKVSGGYIEITVANIWWEEGSHGGVVVAFHGVK